MAKNKVIQRKLRNMYGEGCFFHRAGVAERIEAMGGIRTFKSFTEEKRLKGKKISYQITVHHLKHRSAGGSSSVDNCANVAEIAHQYMHSLSFAEEEIINEMLREFKLNIAMIQGNGQTHETGSFTLSAEPPQEYMSIPVYDTTPEDLAKLEAIREEKRRQEIYNKRKHPTRATIKRTTRELVEEDEEYEI